MSDQNHPLIELLDLTDCGLLTNEINFGIFNNLKEALIADGISTVASDDVVVDLNTDINSSYDFWDKQDDVLIMMIGNYSKSVTEGLVTDLKNLSNQSDCLMVDIEGDLYGGNLGFTELEMWADGFEGDKEALQKIYDKWENVISYIDYDNVIKDLLERK